MFKPMVRLLFITLLAVGPDAFAQHPSATTVAATRAFITQAEHELEAEYTSAQRAAWVHQTFINDDTKILAGEAEIRLTRLEMDLARRAAGMSRVGLTAQEARKLEFIQRARLLQEGSRTPLPNDPLLATELGQLQVELDSQYGLSKACLADGRCLDDAGVYDVLATSRDPRQMREVWLAWHDAFAKLKPNFARVVELSNRGARELGFKDLGELWRSPFDMPPEAFPAHVDRLWEQVRPLFEALQCHVRDKLAQRYGAASMPADGTIPAHLLGEVSGTLWTNIFDIVAEPTADQAPLEDVGAALVAQKYDSHKLMSTAERLFTSMRFQPLSTQFWERSVLDEPVGREVQCIGSAWDITPTDVRVLFCAHPNAEHLWVMHHELGHIYYDLAYSELPFLFRNSADPSFHEAVGDVIALSLTPEYLRRIGLVSKVAPSQQDAQFLLRIALHKVAVLPLTVLVDRWRWAVLAGEIPSERYTQEWWSLRQRYQGVSAPEPRPSTAFDPAVKYHVARFVPYTRYFLAQVLQFQLFKRACELGRHRGALHRCSLYGNGAAGAGLQSMMALGARMPWPDVLESFTGSRSVDAAAMLEYFAPLRRYLDERNAGRQCVWKAGG